MGNFPVLGGELDVDGLRSSADTGVIRAPEQELHQGKMENKSLCGAQCEEKNISTVEIASSE